MTTRLLAVRTIATSLAAFGLAALAIPASAQAPQFGPRAVDPLPERWPDNVPHSNPEGWSTRVEQDRQSVRSVPMLEQTGAAVVVPVTQPGSESSEDDKTPEGAAASVPPAELSPPDIDDASLFERGIGAIEADQAEQGQRLLEQLVARSPATPLADEARRRLARIYAERYAAEAKAAPAPAAAAAGSVAATPAPGVVTGTPLPAVAPDAAGSPPATAAVTAPAEEPPAPWRDRARRSHRFEGLMSAEVGDRIFFGLASSEVGSRARTVLERQARWIKRFPDLYVVVEGHADDPGDDAANRVLSLERALTARRMLIQAGVSPDRIDVDPRGRQDRLADCASPQCQAQNRRALTRLMVVLPVRPEKSSSVDVPAAAAGARRLADDGTPFAPGPRGDR
ncbi:MAG: OmpA family protein [Hyphomicrobiaceae bacterium]